MKRTTTKQSTSEGSEPATSKHSELHETIEALRKDKFPKLPKTLVADILRIESENLDDRHAAMAELSEAVEKYLSKEA
jgi:hypothetical protein